MLTSKEDMRAAVKLSISSSEIDSTRAKDLDLVRTRLWKEGDKPFCFIDHSRILKNDN